MRTSMGTLSRTLHRSLLSTLNPNHHLPRHFSTTLLSDSEDSPHGGDSPSPPPSQTERTIFDRPLENGLDVGIYRAILVGKVGQTPLQKKLKSGTVVTLLSLGTGGIRNNRRPLDNESPRDYANRCAVQWHRVTIYPERLGTLVMKHATPGSTLYVEGNLESKVFSDPTTGLVRRIREVSVRRNGRVVFLGQGGDADADTQQNDLKAVGYY
ncbi:single-stranded DNA-binding protein, mitochondrial [Lotus japonicus]|uniref:single-stranded DNA-binding protein, mitochondrial n=1 Tax=Lotus japonicus TaxID=34305 RepID=UPI00258A9D41|nr:single-stranded DNA-binding protein, mitochondrial [Lotus japonicus]